MRIDCHMHTPLCGHAVGSPEAFVDHALKAGIELITFTCHIPMPIKGFRSKGIRMSMDDLSSYYHFVGTARNYGKSLGVRVLCGIEAEIYPNGDELTPMFAILKAEPFDFVLGSLHHWVPAYQDWLRDNSLVGDEEIIEAYFAHLTVAALSGYYHSMAHLDLIRLYGTVNGFEPEAHEASIRRFIQATIDAGVCLEVNTSGLIKEPRGLHPDPLILRWAAEMGAKLTLGSDAHRPEQVGQFYDQVIPVLQRIGFEHVYYFEDGEPNAIELA